MVAVVLLLPLLLAAPAHAADVRPGDLAPAFTLPDWRGRRVSLADHRGRVVCIDVWASWCRPCRAALPGLDAIARRHRDAGLTVLAVNVDRSRAAAERFLAERLPAPTLTLLHDPEGTMPARYGAAGMPVLWIVDRDGVVREVEVGYSPDDLARIERVIVQLLRPDGGAVLPPLFRTRAGSG